MAVFFPSYFSLLTIRKIFNLLKLFAGYYFSRLTGKVYMWGMPAGISAEPIAVCNLACPECPMGTERLVRNANEMDMDTYKRIIDASHPYLLVHQLFFQGEPFLSPHLFEMVRYARKKKIYTITSTNGHFLNNDQARETVESGLSGLIISIDGTTQDIYEKYRKGGDLEIVCNGVRNLVRWKKQLGSSTPEIVVQFLVFSFNEHQITEIFKFGKDLGADKVELKSAQIYDFRNGYSLIPENNEWSRYRRLKDGTWTIKSRLANHCWRMWSSVVFDCDGNAVPCCFDKDGIYNMGNIREKSFAEIWKGKNAHTFRSSILRNRRKLEICNNCTEGLIL